MSAYETRCARWLKLAEHLPPELKGRIALRNIRAAAALAPQAQKTLACALDAGLRQAGTIRLLQRNPEMTLDEIIRQLQAKRKPGGNGHQSPHVFDDENSVRELCVLIQTCFPGWNALATESLAADPLTAELRALLHAWHGCQELDRARSETFTVLLCGFIVQAAEHLKHILDTSPNHCTALRAGGVHWPFLSEMNTEHD